MTQPRIFLLNPSRVTSFAILALALPLALASATPLQAQTYSEIYSFNVTGDPMNPQNTGQITQGRDGNLWTATRVGGSFGVGAAFNIMPSGALTVIENFNYPSGVEPFGGLILGTDGNFYGTAESGGTFGIGTLFKITSTGTLTTSYNFGTCVYPCKEGAYPKTPPVEGTDGNYYGTVGTRLMERTTAWSTS